MLVVGDVLAKLRDGMGATAIATPSGPVQVVIDPRSGAITVKLAPLERELVSHAELATFASVLCKLLDDAGGPVEHGIEAEAVAAGGATLPWRSLGHEAHGEDWEVMVVPAEGLLWQVTVVADKFCRYKTQKGEADAMECAAETLARMQASRGR